MEKTKKSKLTIPQILVLGVIGTIIIGTILLSLPISNANGKSLNFMDTVFTATSIVCVNGLNLVAPAQQFSTFGKIVIMCLIEIGGIGFMSFIALILMLMKKKINFSERILIKESLNQNNDKGILKLIKKIFLYVAVLEIIGAILLSVKFIPEYGVKTGIFYSIFHSISAVCNAGIDILGDSSLMKYQSDSYISIVIMILVIIGGLGYTVWNEIILSIKKIFKRNVTGNKIFNEISTHTKIVLITTAILLISGTIFTFLLEKDNINTMGNDELGTKILKSSFFSTTLRSAGFETIDTNNVTTATKLISMIYIIIGGSPGSTAGGIKTTTLVILVFMIIGYFKGNENTVIFKRTVSQKILKRAIMLLLISIVFIITSIIGLLVTENVNKEPLESQSTIYEEDTSMVYVAYEVVSAYGTAGITLGLTPNLTNLGKIIIMILMIIGRVGSITISYAILKNSNNQKKFNYPECDILVG